MRQINSMLIKMVNGLYSLFLRRLREIKYPYSKIIPFPYVFEKLCRNFSIKKEECWEILRLLKKIGVIELTFGRGVTINEFDEIEILEIIN